MFTGAAVHKPAVSKLHPETSKQGDDRARTSSLMARQGLMAL